LSYSGCQSDGFFVGDMYNIYYYLIYITFNVKAVVLGVHLNTMHLFLVSTTFVHSYDDFVTTLVDVFSILYVYF